MKRLVFFIMLVLFGVTLLSCASNSFTIEQSKKNYETYCDAVQLVADKHGIELTEVTDYSSYKDICVQTNIGRIDIRITNSAFEAEKGVESFSIDYFLSSENSIEESDIKLFCDFANCRQRNLQKDKNGIFRVYSIVFDLFRINPFRPCRVKRQRGSPLHKAFV